MGQRIEIALLHRNQPPRQPRVAWGNEECFADGGEGDEIGMRASGWDRPSVFDENSPLIITHHIPDKKIRRNTRRLPSANLRLQPAEIHFQPAEIYPGRANFVPRVVTYPPRRAEIHPQRAEIGFRGAEIHFQLAEIRFQGAEISLWSAEISPTLTEIHS